MDHALRNLVWRRAANRCEYCRLPQSAVDATFHVEHVVAKQLGGGDGEDNLALSCDRCNLFKGPNLSSIDGESGEIVVLFNPRRDTWNDHFALEGASIRGLTPTGRATVSLLQMNVPRRRALRAFLIRLTEW